MRVNGYCIATHQQAAAVTMPAPSDNMSAYPLRILIVEDVPTDAELMERSLRRAGLRFIAKRVDIREEFSLALGEFKPEIILADYKLSDFDGLAALELVKRKRPDVPVIIVSGALDDEQAAELMTCGARDFVLKDRIARLPAAIKVALTDVMHARRQMQAKAARQVSDQSIQAIANSVQDAVILMDSDGRISLWNPAAEKMFGYRQNEVLGQQLHAMLAPERYSTKYPVALANFWKTGQGAIVGKTVELLARRKDGTEFPIELSVSAVRLEHKWTAIGILRDITQRKAAEELLHKNGM